MEALKEIISDHISYRKQILKLAKSDLIKTYSGSVLGWLWALVKPIITVCVFWFAFTIGLRGGAPVNNYPFFLWLVAGLVPWFYMRDMISGGTRCIRRYKYLVTKMKFPVSTIPTFVSISNLAVNLVLLLLAIVIFCGFGHAPDIYFLQIPFYIFLSFLFFTSWGLLASLLGSISKDFINLVKSFMTAIFWLSGIIWNPDNIDIPWLQKILEWNPVTYLVRGFRNCFINKIWFWQEPKTLIYFIIILAILFVLAIWAYKKLRKDIADVL